MMLKPDITTNKMKKYSFLTLTLILLYSPTFSDPFCDKNCGSCTSKFACQICIGHRKLEDLCDSKPADDSENCIAYTSIFGTTICAICKENYSMDLTKTGDCVERKKELGDCINSFIIDGVETCFVCNEGLPDVVTGVCVPKEKLPNGYWIQDCEWGNGAFKNGDSSLAECAKCTGDLTYFKGKRVCKKVAGNNCILFDEDKDQCFCNAYNGDVQTGETSCAKLT